MKKNIFLFGSFLFFLLTIFLYTNFVFSENYSIVFSEICPTGCASSDYQWLEIYNNSDTEVDLESWIFFEQNTNHSLKISPLSSVQNFKLAPSEYAIIVQNDQKFFEHYLDISVLVLDSSWGTLNKSGEEIALKDPQGNFIEKFIYQQIENNNSLERVNFNLLVSEDTNWLENPNGNSVGKQNFNYINNNQNNFDPVAIINSVDTAFVDDEVLFSGASSYDSDGEIENYYWDFGDGNFILGGAEMNSSFAEKKNFTIRLKVVDDDLLENIVEKQINILEKDLGNNSSTDDFILLINEFCPDPVSGNEWIELYSNNPNLNLKNYSLFDGVGKIFSFTTDFFVTNTFFAIELSSAKLNNSGDSLHLKNDQNELVDEISYGINLAAPQKGNSLARVIDGVDTDSMLDFIETKNPTKSAKNIITSDVVLEEENLVENQSSIKKYYKSDILINELVSDPSDGEVEFIELYNNIDEIIDLKNFFIEDGGGSKTILTGEIPAHSYFVIENPKGSLNNNGDLVVLYSLDKIEIDKVVYGNWDDGNLSDNAPVPKDPLSLNRKIEGLDSDNDFYDFVLSDTITKMKKNILSLASGQNLILDEKLLKNIVINEVFPNPIGDDSEDEFIELKNIGQETINISNWKIGDSSKTRYEIKDLSLKAGEIISLDRKKTKIALNNSGGDEVKLFFSDGSLLNSINYLEKADEGLSYVRKDDGSFVWTTEASPNKENIFKGKSAAAIISIDVDTEVLAREEIIFDASDTIDPFGNQLFYEWNFDDGTFADGAVVRHSFLNEGIYTVLLEVTSAENKSEKKVVINVKNILDFKGSYVGLADVEKIQISEILANPEGSDTTEFIELYNPTEKDIDISGLKLDDEEGGSRAYTLPNSTIIKSLEYKIFGRQDSKLALNNTSDEVRYLYPDGTIIDYVRFEDVLEGASYVKNDDNVWVWTSTLTPSEKNILSEVQEKSKTTIVKSKMIKPVILTTLENIRSEDVGDIVQVIGTVAVEPGILGSQYFYIVGSPGIQVYSYKKDFPDLKVGDKVEVTGELAEISGEARLKISSKDDIQIVEKNSPPETKKIEIFDVEENYEGWLVEVSGEITEIKTSYMYIDDGNAEAKIYFKSGAKIDKKKFSEGDLVTVKGIVNQTKNGFQILPRNQIDIAKVGTSEEFIQKQKIDNRESAQDLAEKYLTATAGGLTAIFFGLFAKNNSTKIEDFVSKFRKKT